MTNSTPQSRVPIDAAAATPVRGSDQAFGLVFSVVFALIALYPLFAGGAIRLWAAGIAGLFFAVALVRPRLLSPLNKIWAKFGLALHRVVSPLALLIVFCLAVLPTSLVIRALRKDLLRLRFEPASETYWIERKPPGRADQQMKKQF